ncbi:ThuA domain-containing protein [bacterium]|nr:ThuA domain-containing protein [bacterium]
MGLFNKAGRQGVLRAGLPLLAAGTAAVPGVNAAINPEEPGKTKVVAILGTDDSHNGVGYEIQIRKIFESKKDWQLIVVRANKFFTPELIRDADLLITCQKSGADSIDVFSGDGGLADTMAEGVPLWTDTNVKAIIDNVRNRGMGLIALHNTILAGNRQFVDFLDVREIMCNELEPLWVTRINKNHPIMQGIGKFMIANDEQFAVIIKSTSTATLFETTAIHEKRQVISGWALDSGNGRIVGLLPGHTIDTYKEPEYRNIIWRAAHWAMKRTIEPYPNAQNRYYI